MEKDKQAQCKRDIYEQQAMNCLPKCAHNNGKAKVKKNNRFMCGQVAVNDVALIRKIFAGHLNSVDQNRYILSQVTVYCDKLH